METAVVEIVRWHSNELWRKLKANGTRLQIFFLDNQTYVRKSIVLRNAERGTLGCRYHIPSFIHWFYILPSHVGCRTLSLPLYWELQTLVPLLKGPTRGSQMESRSQAQPVPRAPSLSTTRWIQDEVPAAILEGVRRNGHRLMWLRQGANTVLHSKGKVWWWEGESALEAKTWDMTFYS